MRRDRLLVGLAVAIAALLAYAWYDGGEREQRLIAVPVELPGAPR